MELELLRIQSCFNLAGALTLAVLCMSGPANDYATLLLLTHSSALKMVITHCSVVRGNFGCSATHSACSSSLSFPLSLCPLGTPGACGEASHGEPDKVQTLRGIQNPSLPLCLSVSLFHYSRENSHRGHLSDVPLCLSYSVFNLSYMVGLTDSYTD